MKFSIVLALCLAGVRSTSVKFQDCGSDGGTVNQVLVDPCPSEPCAFKRGQPVNIEVDFTASVKSSNATFQADASIFGVDFPLNIPEPDACNLPKCKCPLTPGGTYGPGQTVNVPTEIPSTFGVPLPIKVKLIGDNGLVLLCGEVKVKIT